jgi:hypothetical protein
MLSFMFGLLMYYGVQVRVSINIDNAVNKCDKDADGH